MHRRGVLFVVVVCAVFWVISRVQMSTSPTRIEAFGGATPLYGWKTVQTEVVPIDAGSQRWWTYRTPQAPGLRVTVTATLPIDIAIPSTTYEDLIRAGQWNTWTGNCTASNVLSTTLTCDLPQDAQPPIVLVHDRRDTSGGSQLTAMLGAVIGVKRPLEEMASRNDIHIEIAHWECVDHCIE